MNTAREKYYRFLFLATAIYDLALGIVFMFFCGTAFEMLGIPEKQPQFSGYMALIGAFLFVIGVAYYLIFLGDLQRNRDLIIVGALYKLAYSATAFIYFLAGSIPHVLFVALFGVLDLVLFVLMLECLLFLRKNAARV